MASHPVKLEVVLAVVMVLVCSVSDIDAKDSPSPGLCSAGFATCKNGHSCQTAVSSDVDNCGGCGVKCPNAPHSRRKCQKGTCGNCCNDRDWKDCDGNNTNGCETNVDVSTKHCGKCGAACTAPQDGTSTCSRGICGFRCASGFNKCQNNSCSPVRNEISNCGGCGKICPAPLNSDATCTAGSCGFTCHPGFQDCDGNATNGCETDVSGDSRNCGACNATCSSGTCSGSKCTLPPLSCDPGFVDCDGNYTNGSETDLRSDPDHCGACNATCSLAKKDVRGVGICKNSTCDVFCEDTTYMNNCDGDWTNGCETYLRTSSHCGSCNMSCDRPHAVMGCNVTAQGASNQFSCELLWCEDGWQNCDGDLSNGCETDVQNDTDHCGACDTTCSLVGRIEGYDVGICRNSTCDVICGDTRVRNCDNDWSNGCEAYLGSSPNCGGCGVNCDGPHVAVMNCYTPPGANAQSSCALVSCEDGWQNCDGDLSNGCETDVRNGPTNCGACNATCSGPCAPGWGDCDGNTINGCETNLRSDPGHCGACNTTCSLPTPVYASLGICKNSSCDVYCQDSARFQNCDGDWRNGCETNLRGDRLNCGACNRTCSVGCFNWQCY